MEVTRSVNIDISGALGRIFRSLLIILLSFTKIIGLSVSFKANQIQAVCRS